MAAAGSVTIPNSAEKHNGEDISAVEESSRLIGTGDWIALGADASSGRKHAETIVESSSAEHERQPALELESESAMLEPPVTALFDPPKRRVRILFILIFYLPLLIVPWTLLCIMRYRPLSATIYVDNTGKNTPHDFQINERWQTAINVMNAIAAVLTVPVTSLLLAEAAVVWLQQGDASKPKPPVSLAHFFDLADRGWTDIGVLRRELTRSGNTNDVAGRNWFLLCAAGFILLCGIFLPLQQLLVRSEILQVVTCEDVPNPPRFRYGSSSCGYIYTNVVSQDPQPGMLGVLPLWNVKEQVKARLATADYTEQQALLWTNVSDGNTAHQDVIDYGQIRPHYDGSTGNVPFWVSAIPNGTTTGVLRQHAMRLNSSVSCQPVAVEDFPKRCLGPYPFTAEYSWNHTAVGNDTANEPQLHGVNDYRLSVCVPGDYTHSPWNRSRDALTIHEKIYLALAFGNASAGTNMLLADAQKPFGVHCSVNTTRGYFELGNAFNAFLPQPLLEKFPRAAESAQYNDYDDGGTIDRYPPYTGPMYVRMTFIPLRHHRLMFPSDNGTDYNLGAGVPTDMPVTYQRNGEDSESYLNAPGPLAISAVALFGNESFFGMSKRAMQVGSRVAMEDLCQTYRIPFLSADRPDFLDFNGNCQRTTLESGEPESADQYGYDITSQLLSWFRAFNDTSAAVNALGIATYYASEALLTQGANAAHGSRSIYSSDGRTTQRPSMSIGSMIALCALLAVEVVGLTLIAVYRWRTPTWTSTLRSLTVAQLANTMDRGTLPSAGSSNDRVLQVLHQIDGRVGVAVVDNDGGKSVVEQLVHGGPGSLPAPSPRERSSGYPLLGFSRTG